jgi:hypothetical protein
MHLVDTQFILAFILARANEKQFVVKQFVDFGHFRER